MKLKYYLRGLGVGIICTAILMGIALSGNKKEKLTDTEIIERARLLGMVMAEEAADGDGSDAQGMDGQEGGTSDAQGNKDSKDQGQEENPDAQAKGDSAGQEPADSKGQDPSGKDGNDSGNADQKGDSTAQDGQGSDSQSQEASGQKEGSSTDKPQGTDKETSGNQPSSGSSVKTEGMVEFEITERDHSEEVSKKLFEAGLIEDATEFNQYMIEKKMDDHLQTGKYQIPAGATADEILEMIVRLP